MIEDRSAERKDALLFFGGQAGVRGTTNGWGLTRSACIQLNARVSLPIPLDILSSI
jgi:hypothetical protein